MGRSKIGRKEMRIVFKRQADGEYCKFRVELVIADMSEGTIGAAIPTESHTSIPLVRQPIDPRQPRCG